MGLDVGGVFIPASLQHQLHQLHQHHSRLAAVAASSALSNASQSEINEAEAAGIRGVLPGNNGSWPYLWRPPHGLQGLDHPPAPNDIISSLSRVSPASASIPQRGESSSII